MYIRWVMPKALHTVRKFATDSVLNQSVRYYLVSKGWLALAVPTTMILVSMNLTAEEQGFWYTMSTLLSYQQLADFGFTIVLAQFLSHEWIRFTQKKDCSASSYRPERRMAALIRRAMLWAPLSIAAVGAILGVFGFTYMSHAATSSTNWVGPWLCLTAIIAVSYIGNLLRTMVDSRGHVYHSQRALFVGSLIGYLASWIALQTGARLYSMVIFQAIQVILVILMLVTPNIDLFRMAWLEEREDTNAWTIDFRRTQWRAGLTWLAGLLMYQTMVPIVFGVRGPEEAGRFGILIQAYSFTNLVAGAWLLSSNWKLATYWVHGDAKGLRSAVATLTSQCVMSAALAGLAGLLLLTLLKNSYPTRFPDIKEAFLILSISVLQQRTLVRSAATRSAKSEPFLVPTFISGLLVLAGAGLAAHVSTFAVATVFAVVVVGVMLPWTDRIFEARIAALGSR
jgi:hypothetical protein